MDQPRASHVALVQPSASRDFPPRFVDFATMTDAEIARLIGELIEYATIEPITVRARVDPRFGAECLRRSKGNVRHTGDDDIGRYRRDMEFGAWRYSWDAWAFTVDGVYCNAHHRARALRGASARTVIEISVAFGVPSDAVASGDRGKTRSQAFAIGKPKPAVSAVRAAMTIMRGGSAMKYADREVHQSYLVAEPALAAFPPISQYQAPFWGVMICLYPALPEKVAAFTHEMCANETTNVHSTIRLLRKRLRGEDSSIGRARSTDSQWWLALNTMMAFRAYAEGRSIERLMLKDQAKAKSASALGIVSWFNMQTKAGA
jgi:hypothetical protein